MRLARMEQDGSGKPVAVVEKTRKGGFLWLREIPYEERYLLARKLCPGYWSWLKLPDLELVPDGMSFQLDAWYREQIGEN